MSLRDAIRDKLKLRCDHYKETTDAILSLVCGEVEKLKVGTSPIGIDARITDIVRNQIDIEHDGTIDAVLALLRGSDMEKQVVVSVIRAQESRIRELETALAASREREKALEAAARVLLEKCDEADAAGDLPENIDGSVLDLVRSTLDKHKEAPMRDIAGDVFELEKWCHRRADDFALLSVRRRIYLEVADKLSTLRAKFPAQGEEVGLRKAVRELVKHLHRYQAADEYTTTRADAGREIVFWRDKVDQILSDTPPAPSPDTLPRKCETCGRVFEPGNHQDAGDIIYHNAWGHHFTTKGDQKCTGTLKPFERRGGK